MNIHLFHDDKFTNGAIEQFERFYPDQNRYIVLLYNTTELTFTAPHKNMITYPIRDKKIVSKMIEIISTSQMDNLFVHYLDPYKASITLKVLAKQKLNFYWIFYGADLYEYLTKYHQYDILDHRIKRKKNNSNSLIKDLKYLLWFGWTTKGAMKKAFKKLDYFCFWNEYDYKLFRSKVESTARHKNFIYYNALGNPDFPLVEKKNIMMINHSASPSGNHFHIFDTLKGIDLVTKAFKILLPLSYGNKTYIDAIEHTAKSSLDAEIISLRDFMPLNKYQATLAEVKIAIFGMRRQEAAGNIFQLLNMGAKVFLRTDNTLFKWLKERNFIVFSLEDDFSELQELNGLSIEQIEHNRKCYAMTFNPTVYKEIMLNLID